MKTSRINRLAPILFGVLLVAVALFMFFHIAQPIMGEAHRNLIPALEGTN